MMLLLISEELRETLDGGSDVQRRVWVRLSEVLACVTFIVSPAMTSLVVRCSIGIRLSKYAKNSTDTTLH